MNKVFAEASVMFPYYIYDCFCIICYQISTLTNLRTFSKAMWKDHCTKLHDPNNTSSPTSDLDADIANCYANPQDLLAADCQLLNRPISKVLKSKHTHKTRFLRGIRRAHRRFLAEHINRQYTIRHYFDPSVPTLALIDPHLPLCSISCTLKSHAGPALVKMDPARVDKSYQLLIEVTRSLQIYITFIVKLSVSSG